MSARTRVFVTLLRQPMKLCQAGQSRCAIEAWRASLVSMTVRIFAGVFYQIFYHCIQFQVFLWTLKEDIFLILMYAITLPGKTL